MSWAEDEGIDCWFGDEIPVRDLEKEWESGFHTDRQGERHKLSEMDTKHLINTIKFFEKRYNTKDLEKELSNRK